MNRLPRKKVYKTGKTLEKKHTTSQREKENKKQRNREKEQWR